MPSLHFVTGSTAAGKTSYSQHLAENLGAFRFSVEEWLKSLYGAEVIEKASEEWINERIRRCESLAKRLSEQALSLRQVVVLDFGFQDVAQRERFYKWARSNGVSYRLHFLDIPAKERWKRVSTRNEEVGSSSFKLSKEAFDRLEKNFDRPSADELEEHQGVRLMLDKP